MIIVHICAVTVNNYERYQQIKTLSLSLFLPRSLSSNLLKRLYIQQLMWKCI